MSELVTTLGKYNEAGFQPENHLGMWVKIPAANVDLLRKNYQEVESDGFELIDMALILNTRIDDITKEDWELRVKPVTDQLHKITDMINEKGEVRIRTAKIGTPEKPMIAEFFFVKPTKETINVLMMTFVQLSKGFLPRTLKKIPPYVSELGTNFSPKFIGEVVNS